jgi:hypothetical protein
MTHPIRTVREMSTSLEPKTVTIREFGTAVANALEHLATIIQTSHDQARADAKENRDGLQRLENKLDKLIQVIEKLNANP